MGSRGFSILVISANAAGCLYYLLQERFALALLLGAVAGGVAWLAFRAPSSRTTIRPVRTLTAGAACFAVVTLLMVLAVRGADAGDPAVLGSIGAVVGAAFTGVMLWALVRARQMGYGWSSELQRRRRPDDNPGGR